MITPPPPESDVMEELAILKRYFKGVHDELKKGRVVDISGFDQRIAAVCGAVQQSPPEQQRKCLPELTELIRQLDNYGDDLRRLKGLPTGAGAN